MELKTTTIFEKKSLPNMRGNYKWKIHIIINTDHKWIMNKTNHVSYAIRLQSITLVWWICMGWNIFACIKIIIMYQRQLTLVLDSLHIYWYTEYRVGLNNRKYIVWYVVVNTLQLYLTENAWTFTCCGIFTWMSYFQINIHFNSMI